MKFNTTQENFIRILINSKSHFFDSDINKRANSLKINLEFPFVVAEIVVGFRSKQKEHIDENLEKINVFVNDYLKDACYYSHINDNGNIRLLLSNNNETYKTTFAKLLREIKAKFDYQAGVIISQECSNLSDLQNTIVNLDETINYYKHNCYNGVIDINEIKYLFTNMPYENRAICDAIINAFVTGDVTKMSIMLSTFAEKERQKPNINKTSIKSSLIEIASRIINIANHNDVDVDSLLGDTNPYSAISSMKRTERIIEWIIDVSKKIINSSNKKTTFKENEHVEKATKYMEENFDDPNISLHEISNYVGLSDTYFSQLFTSYVGTGVINYLTNLRILNAKKLLVETNIPIDDVAHKSGYIEASYFSIVFKRRVGISAIKYRREQTQMAKKEIKLKSVI